MDCGHNNWKKHGHDRKGKQRYRCRECGVTMVNRVSDVREQQILDMLHCGAGVREVARAVGVHPSTISRRACNRRLAPPVASSGPHECDYCGQQIARDREAFRRTARTRRKFCDHRCYQDYMLNTNPTRLLKYLKKVIFNVENKKTG